MQSMWLVVLPMIDLGPLKHQLRLCWRDFKEIVEESWMLLAILAIAAAMMVIIIL